VTSSSFGHGLNARRRKVGGAAPPPPASNVTSINADGFSAEWDGSIPTGPALSGIAPVLRAGFNSNGNADTWTDTVQVPHRLRTPYNTPAGSNLAYQTNAALYAYTASTVALEDWVCAADALVGGTNNSALVSPAPLFRWVGIDRICVGAGGNFPANTIGIAAAHWAAGRRYAGKQVSAVRFIMTDGTNSVSVVVSTPTLSPTTGHFAGWAGPRVPLFMVPETDISTLNQGLLRLKCEVLPQVGTTASIGKSEDFADGTRWLPSDRFFRHDTTRATTPIIAVVVAGSPEPGGIASTDPAVARANPFPNAFRAKNGILAADPDGIVDGAEIWFRTTPTSLSLNSTTVALIPQQIAALTVKPDPEIDRATIAFVSPTFAPRLGDGLVSPVIGGRYHVQGFNLQRAATGSVFDNSAGVQEVVFIDVNYNNDNRNSVIIATGWNTELEMKWLGCTISGAFSANSFWQQAFAGAPHKFQGCFCSSTGNASVSAWELIGNRFSVVGSGNYPSVSGSNRAFAYFNEIFTITASSATFRCGATGAYVGNMFERSAGGNRILILSGDGEGFSTTHVVVHNNTTTGSGTDGGINAMYDETAGTPRTHVFHSFKGNANLASQASKGDINMADATRLGNRAYDHGVGSRDSFATSTSFPLTFFGMGGANFASAASFEFIDNKSIISGVPGTGGGNYRTNPGSILRGANRRSLVSHDLDGNARPATSDDTGAYYAAP
jgi:hypothetical protein